MKVSLNDIRPPIWRRVQTKDCTLFKLHKVIQASLGWEDYHLHRCDIGGQPCGQKRERTVLLSEIVAQGIAEVGYCYDFGDNWEHCILIEKIVPTEAGAKYPRCVAGERACPPEDCGGPWGYGDFVKAIQNKEHKRHHELLECVGREFDPEKFDMDAVNEELREMG